MVLDPEKFPDGVLPDTTTVFPLPVPPGVVLTLVLPVDVAAPLPAETPILDAPEFGLPAPMFTDELSAFISGVLALPLGCIILILAKVDILLPLLKAERRHRIINIETKKFLSDFIIFIKKLILGVKSQKISKNNGK